MAYVCVCMNEKPLPPQISLCAHCFFKLAERVSRSLGSKIEVFSLLFLSLLLSCSFVHSITYHSRFPIVVDTRLYTDRNHRFTFAVAADDHILIEVREDTAHTAH